MKGMRIVRKQAGGYMSALQQTRPDLYKTISNYRGRLTSPEQQTFDKRANIQYKASMNMPDQMRQAYYKSIEQQYAKPTDAQFQQVREGLKSKTFVPTYSYVDPSTQGPARTTGYYRDLSKEMADVEKQMKGLTITEQKTGTRTPYTLQRSSSGAGLAGYTPPPPSKPVYELPKGYNKEFRTAGGPYNTGGGQTAYGRVGQNTGMYGTYAPSDYYVKGKPEKYTYDVTRAQKAGDAEYDKLAASLSRLQTRHKYRFAPQYSQDGGTGFTSENIYQKLGMAKDGGLKEDLKNKKFSKGGKSSIRGTKFTGVF
jgi:hypothetical protein